MKIAVLTMVFNERHFLPIWIHHYGSQVGRENLYVVDDGSDDGSTAGLGAVKVLRGRKEDLDEDQRAAKLSAIQAELLTLYDAVIVTDADELIVVDPALGLSLADYVDQRVDEIAVTTGFNVQFSLADEDPLDYARPLLRQRSFLQFDQSYCKPLVAKVPVRWIAGFHGCGRHLPLSRDLLLFHLRSADPVIALERLKTLNRVKRSENSIRKGQSEHFGWDEETYLQRVFITDKQAFTAALPAGEFDGVVDGAVDTYWRGDLGGMRELYRKLVRVPERFFDTISLPAPV